MLTGTKTYLFAALLIALAAFAMVTGRIGVFIALQTAAGALSIGTVRAAVKKIEILTRIIPPTWWSKIGGFIPGTKTYLTSAACAVFAVLAWATGEQRLIATVAVIVAAVGISTLRMAIKRIELRLQK